MVQSCTISLPTAKRHRVTTATFILMSISGSASLTS
ncbi:Uncharacterised protein [Vibrio cholerae]|nr:Uncharacterised protein [Vibrio cholerae]